MPDLFYIEIIIIATLIILNGLAVLSEIALISARKIKLQLMANEGDKRAETALDLINDPNRFLSTMQIFVTLISILAGTFGGATIAQRLDVYLNQINFLPQYSSVISVVIVVLLITYFTLIIGELVPKRVAINNSEGAAVIVARPVQILATIVSPVVVFLGASTNFVLKLLGSKPREEVDVAEDQIKLLIEEGTRTGEFEEAEEKMIKRVFDLDERRITTLMTPKAAIAWVDANEPVEEIEKKIFESKHSIIPVSDGYLDNFLGVVQVKDIIKSCSIDNKLNIREFLKKPLIVPEGSRTLDVLKQFKNMAEEIHMAIIVDEYGDIEGLITLYDILEAIVGDLPSEEELKAIKRSDGSWLIDGLINIDEFKKIFNIDKLPDEHISDYHTLAGFIITYLGRIPGVEDKFTWDSLQFEILDMDGYHIDKVLVLPLAG